MRKISMIVAAMALVLGLSQCKKDQGPKVIEEPVEITLDVSANKGSRIDVDTESGIVRFQQNDKVLVGSNGKYVGTLTCRGDKFKGQIAGALEGEPLKFFFLGNKYIADTLLTPGTTTSCTVNISDQTSYLPVISSATSQQVFTGEGNYNAYFYNKAALVMFNVTTSATASVPTVIRGMNNTVTVSFADVDNFSYGQAGKGEIKLPGGSGERWAILLPQDATTGSTAYASNGSFAGHCDAVPAIDINDYLFDGIDVTVTTSRCVDLGLPSGRKWAGWNVDANAPEEFGGYYAWGEIEEKEKYDDTTYTYRPETYPSTLPADHDVATVKWGANWRMPTRAEFQELYNNTYHEQTYQNGVFGCKFTASNGNSIFLPAAGRKTYTYVDGIPHYGLSSVGGCYYWTNTYRNNTSLVSAYCFYAYEGVYSIEGWQWAFYGYSIRPVYIGS